MSKWDKDSITALLDRSDKAVLKALLQLYARQTESERQMNTTTDANGVGFNYRDAEVLCDIAKRVRQWGRLTPKQTVLVRGRIKKYWRQLAEIANASGKPVPAQLLGVVVAPEPTAAEAESMAARVEEAEAVDAWIAHAAANGGMVATGDYV
jgi:hypothetical protein